MAELPESPSHPRVRPPKKAAILLVVDNPATVLSLRAILEELDQNVVSARSSEEALQWVKFEEFAVILLDLLMPGISGFDTAKLIRGNDRSSHTPIIFLTTGDIDRSQMERAYALGAVDILGKPLLPIVLQSKVRGFVDLFQDKQRATKEAELLRRLVHGTSDYAIFMLDQEGYVASWNSGAELIKQYRGEEIIGQHFSRFYPQDAIDRGWPAHELKVAKAEGRFEDEGWRIRRDGTRFWANVVITALRNEEGDLQGFSKVTRDLTLRKQAEEALRRSEERFRLLVEGASDYAIFLLDPQGHVASWNTGAERIKGYRAEEIIGQHFSRFYPQDAIDRAWPAHELTVAKAEGRFEDEGWRIRKDGRPFWANVVITALYDDSGDFRGFSKITRDLTERKRSEDNARRLVEEAAARRVAEENARLIRQERERLHVTLASIGDAVISTDAEGRVDFLNPVAERLIGWTTEEAAGCALHDVFVIINEKTRQPVENPADRVLREGVVVGLANHTILIAKDGAERPIDDSAAPIRDAQGNIVGSVLVFRDITERKRAEQNRNARLAVTHALSEPVGLEDGIGGALRAVCENLAWDIGLFWSVSEDGTALESPKSWSRPGVQVSEFEAASCSRTFQLGEGLPGRVWKNGEPDWILDIALDGNFLRLATAVNDGLRSALALPVLVGDRTFGVIEFFARRIREPDADLLEVMGMVAGNLGQFIERKAAGAELLRSEQRLRQLADAMPQIVWTAGPDGAIDYLNRRWTEFTELPQTVSNEAWGQILHPDDAPIANERWAVSLKTGSPFEMEFRLLNRRQQSYRWHLVRTVAVQDGSGRVARWFGTRTDIHEQKKAEESSRYLAEASAELAGVVDYESTLQKVANLAVPYFADWSTVDLADEDGNLRRLAVAHQDAKKIALVRELMRDYPPDPQAASGAFAVLRSGRPERISEITDEMLIQGTKDERHLRLMRSLGLKSYICVPLVVSGKSLGVLTFATAESGHRYSEADLALATDLANRAAVAIENTQLYQALRDADRRKDEFLATLAHELRNPLAPIRNSLQILKMTRLDMATLERSRDMMERQVHHLVRLVDDLLDVSRVMRGKIELRRERIELATVVARAVETVQPLVDAQGHQVSISLPTESLPIDADPIRLAQVVGNLLTNAAKYTEPNGLIWLTAVRDCRTWPYCGSATAVLA